MIDSDAEGIHVTLGVGRVARDGRNVGAKEQGYDGGRKDGVRPVVDVTAALFFDTIFRLLLLFLEGRGHLRNLHTTGLALFGELLHKITWTDFGDTRSASFFHQLERNHFAGDFGEALDSALDFDEAVGVYVDDVAGVVPALAVGGLRPFQNAWVRFAPVAQYSVRSGGAVPVREVT